VRSVLSVRVGHPGMDGGPNRLANGTVVDSCPVGDAVRSNPPKDRGKRPASEGVLTWPGSSIASKIVWPW
jgi:hypothetical protein